MMGAVFDPEIADILSELEDGPRSIQYLADRFNTSTESIKERTQYLRKHDLIISDGDTYTANADKLAGLMEDGDNFTSVVDGITQMDSFLN